MIRIDANRPTALRRERQPREGAGPFQLAAAAHGGGNCD
jgi:hypothetical protein